MNTTNPLRAKFMQLKPILTLRITVRLLQQVFPQIIKNFPAFCGTKRFITAFTTAHTFIPALSQFSPAQGYINRFP